jgi:glucose 1-dehydrogenase
MVPLTWRDSDSLQAVAYFPSARTVRLVKPPPDDVVGPRDVLVRSRFVGLCGTDREIIQGGTPLLPAGSDHLVLGHELVGEAIQVGALVEGVNEGDLVTAMVRRGCERCPTCAAGRADNCLSGDFREYGLRGLHGFARPLASLPGSHVIPVDPSFGVHGVLVEPLSVVEKAVGLAQAARLRLGLDGNERWRALVVGCGTIGLLTVALLRLHAHHIVAVDIRPPQHPAVRLARCLGAEYVHVGPADALAELPHHFDIAFEASGDPVVALALHEHLANGGVQIQIGASSMSQRITIDAGRRVHNHTGRQLQMIGTVNAARCHFSRAVADLRGLLELDGFSDIVTSIHAPAAFEQALWGDSEIKSVLAFDRMETTSCR